MALRWRHHCIDKDHTMFCSRVAAVTLTMFAFAASAEDTGRAWLSEAELSFTGARGNARTLDVRGALRTERERPDSRLRLDAVYYYSEAEGEQNQGRLSAGARQDWTPAASLWLYFLQGRYDYDEFRAWTHRGSTHGGFGYHFVRSDDLKIIARGGVGASKQWDITEDLQPEGVLGLEMDWAFSPGQRLTAETTLFPDLDDLGEYRWVSTLAWRVQVSQLRGIGLSLGIESEYESESAPGIRNYDATWFVGLTVAF
jgi:putative salt-induced outer membrane protein YdiY